MKVGEQCLYLAQNENQSKAEAKKTINIGLRNWKFNGGTRKFKNFLKEWHSVLWFVYYINQNC
jgi:hypothetical protein